MLESTLSAVLKSLTKHYVKLHASDIGLGIRGGHLALENVELRVDALNDLKLPFRIISGIAGMLRIDIPWSALSSSPVSVYLENVILVAGPLDYSQSQKQSVDKQKNASRAIKKKSTEKFDGSSSPENSQNGYESDTSSAEEHYTSHELDSKEMKINAKVTYEKRLKNKNKYTDIDEGEVKLSEEMNFDDSYDESENLSLNDTLEDASGGNWHHTILGRLLFNISLEVYGLKLEYADRNIRAAVSLASLESYSTDSEWKHSPLLLDEVVNGKAFALRKKIKLKGLQIFVLPFQTQNEHTKKSNSQQPNIFEAHNPVINGLGLVIKVLICAGGEGPEAEVLATEVDIETDEPNVCLSARQFQWLSSVFAKNSSFEKKPSQQKNKSSNNSSDSVNLKRNPVTEIIKEPESKPGRLRSFWNQLFGENEKEIDDEVAEVLGFETSYEESYKEYRLVTDAVSMAHASGGFTLKARLKTSDLECQKEISRLRYELEKERQMRLKYQNFDAIVQNAEEKYQTAQNEIVNLREKNSSLRSELMDLEKLVTESSRNKDALIRQMEAALARAERNMQAMIQKSALVPNANGKQKPNPNAPLPGSQGAAENSKPQDNISGKVVTKPANKLNRDGDSAGLLVL